MPSSQCSALVHFSGHGLEIDGENFLVPVDASSSASKEAIKQECISLKHLLACFYEKLAGNVLLIFFLDCCRENPTKSIKFKSSFAKLNFSSPLRMFVGFATAPDQVADSKNLKIPNLSPFTYAIVDCLRNSSISSSNIDIFMQSVRGLVEDVTESKQSPFHETNFRQNFRLPLLFDGEYQGAGCSEARASSDPAMEAMSMVGVHCLGVGRDASVFQERIY